MISIPSVLNLSPIYNLDPFFLVAYISLGYGFVMEIICYLYETENTSQEGTVDEVQAQRRKARFMRYRLIVGQQIFIVIWVFCFLFAERVSGNLIWIPFASLPSIVILSFGIYLSLTRSNLDAAAAMAAGTAGLQLNQQEGNQLNNETLNEVEV